MSRNEINGQDVLSGGNVNTTMSTSTLTGKGDVGRGSGVGPAGSGRRCRSISTKRPRSFEAMLAGWARQQKSRLLADSTVSTRLSLLRRFADLRRVLSVDLESRRRRGLHGSLMSGKAASRTFDDPGLPPDVADVLRLPLPMPATSGPTSAATASVRCPSQVCHEWNTVAHLNEYEGNPARRPVDLRRGAAASSTSSTTGSTGWRARAAKVRWLRCATPR